jgi:hypothetical protein
MSWNINGNFTAKIKDIVAYCLRNDIHVSALQETNLDFIHMQTLTMIRKCGYWVHIDCPRESKNKHHGFGTVTLVRHDLKPTRAAQQFEEHPMINIQIGTSSMNIINIYNDFQMVTQKRMVKLNENGIPADTIICGDFNCDLRIEVPTWLQQMDFHPSYFSDPLEWTRKSGETTSCIDHFGYIKSMSIRMNPPRVLHTHDLGHSDHRPIINTFGGILDREMRSNNWAKNATKKELQSLAINIEEIAPPLLDRSSIREYLNNMTNTIKDTMEENRIERTKKKMKHREWLSKEVFEKSIEDIQTLLQQNRKEGIGMAEAWKKVQRLLFQKGQSINEIRVGDSTIMEKTEILEYVRNFWANVHHSDEMDVEIKTSGEESLNHPITDTEWEMTLN